MVINRRVTAALTYLRAQTTPRLHEDEHPEQGEHRVVVSEGRFELRVVNSRRVVASAR